jgi:hypothetical protein
MLSDVFSGISLNIEKPFQIGDEILLEGGAEGQVIEINWRSTHLRNSANVLVIVPNSSGLIEATRQVPDGRKLKVARLGPGDSFGALSLLTGMHTEDVTLTSLTSGLLLGLDSKDLEPILQSRPELIELLSQSVAKLQQFLAMFDQSVIQPAAMSQPDLLWHIKQFFRLAAGRDSK